MNQKHYFQDLNKIVDSHCHLDFQDFDKDRDKIINNAKISNVDYLLTISVNLEDFDKVHEVTQNYENIWCLIEDSKSTIPVELFTRPLARSLFAFSLIRGLCLARIPQIHKKNAAKLNGLLIICLMVRSTLRG